MKSLKDQVREAGSSPVGSEQVRDYRKKKKGFSRNSEFRDEEKEGFSLPRLKKHLRAAKDERPTELRIVDMAREVWREVGAPGRHTW